MLLFCAVLIKPFAEIGISDDFSYVRTAQMLAATGHIVYNRWAAMPMGWQLYLGALFIKWFGFSFTVTRVSVFVVSLVNAYLTHRVATQFGLTAWNATLATLTVILSPAWLMMELNFMSDASGLFCIVLCMYACQRALLAHSSRSALGWIWFAGLSNIADGTVRQTAWLGVLVLVPATAWLMRRTKGALLSGVLIWVVGFIAILGYLHWYYAQPFSVPEKLFNGWDVITFSETLLRSVSTLAMLSLPVLMVSPLALGRLSRRQRSIAFITAGIVSAAVVGVIGALFLHGNAAAYQPLVPLWLPDNITYAGVKQQNEIAGHAPVFLHLPYRLLLTLSVVVSVVCSGFLLKIGSHSPEADQGRVKSRALSRHDTHFLLLMFAGGYAAVLIPRAFIGMIFDRYMLPLVMVLVILVLRRVQERAGKPSYMLGWATLCFFTCFAVAATHDLYAFDRARVTALDEVTNSGVPRTSLEGGFEYDGWTQILTTGFIPDPGLMTEAPGFRRDNCRNFFYVVAPSVKPRYLISFDASGCYPPSVFASVPYQAWLPPHRRFLYVQQVY
ncbi:MAG TPA: hypothetical protein VGG80_10625 [Acidobacteriaceae bacterium]|jgi:hypothetical protein